MCSPLRVMRICTCCGMAGPYRSGLSETFAIFIRHAVWSPRRTCGSEIYDGAHAMITNNITGDVTVI